MEATGWNPPDSERSLGLGFYGTSAPGALGLLKQDSSDFEVREISAYPLPDPEGAYVILRVESRDWEQHELADSIARQLRLRPRSVRWAGTKDRRAIAERLFSYPGPSRDGLDLPGVVLRGQYRSREGLTLGHHYGNVFGIAVRSLDRPPSEMMAAYDAVRDELRRQGWFPNFFGLQRFGEVRPITQDVGRALVRGDVPGAVDLYLCAIPAGSEPTTAPARRAYAQDHDAVRALRDFPREYRFERTMLQHLAEGRTPERALRGLARELRLLFVHAYQSLLFNRWLAQRRAEGLPLDRPVTGDQIVRLGRDGTIRGREATPVAADNLPECGDLVSRGRALVAGPLVGSGTEYGPGRPGEILSELLAQEGVSPQAFALPQSPDISSKGAWRAIVVPVPPLSLSMAEGRGSSASAPGVRFQFALPKGAYATVLMREFLKSGATARA